MKRKIFICGLFSLMLMVTFAASCGGKTSTTTTSPSGSTSQNTTTTSSASTTSTTTTTTSTQPITTTTKTTATSTTSTTTTTTTTTNPTTTTTSTTTTPTETLGDILSRATGTVSYEMVTSDAPDQVVKYWVKNNKMRYQMSAGGEVMITILDVDTRIMYTWSQGDTIAMKMTLPAVETQPAGEQAQAVADYDYTIVGTETFDGKVCLVVQYSANGQTTKMWLWKEKGFPLKVESAGTTIEYRNFDFGDIDDSMFTVPPGMEIFVVG